MLLRLFFTLMVVIVCLSTCTPSPVPISSPQPTTSTVEQPESAAIVTATDDSPATSEPIVTPEDLDREFADSEEFSAARDELVDRYVTPVVDDPRVVAALRSVPRHSFIPTRERHLAYRDHPLSIGYGQTISQPSLVAMMTALLALESDDRVLEIGTGSGYQAAILREITAEVYSVEIIPELAGTARAVLDQLGYTDIHLARRDGYYGWPEYAPYAAIIVTAAPDHMPPVLVEQLDPDGGRMVIPIGPVGNVQTLWLVTRHDDDVQMEQVLQVRFVPFTRDED